jgi:taurine dioxygenase
MKIGNLRIGHRPHLAERYEYLKGRSYDHFKVRPLSTTIGGEIQDAQLARLDAGGIADVRQALLDFRVLFFRDQELTIQEHKAFAENFGPIEEHPFIPSKDGHPDVTRFEKGPKMIGVENQWHSDVSWREVPSFGSVLRAVEVPDVGGDTLFADMVAAYECLDDAMKARLDGLYAIHDFASSFGLLLSAEEREEKRKEFPPARHPVVRTNPDTGERCLYVNAIFTSHIEGMERAESDALLQELYAEAHIPEIQVRFRWEKDSVAFWDNRMVQHYAANDYWPRRRVMERVTIIGERPI